MSIVHEFRLQKEHRVAAVDLFGRIARAMAVPGPHSEDQRVEWEALERVGHRIVGAAAAVQHPIGVHSPDFWPTWKKFVERNAMIDVQLRRGGAINSQAAVDTKATARAEQIEMPADVQAKLGIDRLRVAAPGSFRALRSKPVLDNGTAIRLIRTEWGTDEAQIEFDGDQALRPQSGQTQSAVDASRTEVVVPPGDEVAHCETLAEALGERLNLLAKKLGDRRGDESHGRVLQFALEFLGDRPLASISARDLRQLETALTEIPDRKGIPRQQAKTLYARYRYAKEFGADDLVFVSKTTLHNTYYGSLNSFLAWARTKSDWTPPNFVFNAESNTAPPPQQRDAFRDDELLRFFSLPLFTGCSTPTHFWTPGLWLIQNELYWGFLIHILTGLRPSEIGKLMTVDLEQDGSHWFFDLRRKTSKCDAVDSSQDEGKARKLKSNAAYRRVPVPRLLIDLGLADRKAVLEAAGEARLLPEWHVYRHPQSGREMWGHHLSKSWQYVKAAHSFGRELLTLYSGRHSVAGWYDAAQLPQRIRDRLLGHAPKNVQGSYGPVDLTAAEADAALAVNVPVQVEIADMLLTAKLKAEYGMLKSSPILPVRPRP